MHSWKPLKMLNLSLRRVLIYSKSIAQLLAWVTLLSIIYYTTIAEISTLLTETHMLYGKNSAKPVISYTILTLPLIFFPLGGLLGDVYLGRYKTVISGMAVTAVSMVVFTVTVMLTVKEDWLKDHNIHRLMAVLLLTMAPLLIFGFSVFTSNIIQFGLDQLMERPSESLGMFAHWVVWAAKLGEKISHLLQQCFQKEFEKWLLRFTPVLFFALIIMFLIIAYCTRRHFNRDRVKYNPYKMIFKVLNFARKNKYPVGPVSAFAHCYDFRPSRLDYAKERYGGPFTTSDVEDVKAFKNVLLVLLAVGPVFVLEIPTSKLFFNKLAKHTGEGYFPDTNNTCYEKFYIANVIPLASVVLFPIYIWIVYSVFHSRPIKIFHRLSLGMVLFILSVVSMLVIDFSGHLALHTHNQTQPLCMFIEQKNPLEQTLNLHWTVLIFPSIAKELSDAILVATSFEFISAQSPQAMQGVLVGSLFTLLGIFHVVSGILLIPFTIKRFWGSGYLGQHPPVVSCGFGYYLVCITVAMIGFISFIVAVKRYKYRRRDEEPYSQACVEEIFARRIEDCRRQYGDYEELSGTNEYQ